MPAQTTINVFPDSGHHFEFIPIDPAILQDHPHIKDAIIKGDHAKWFDLDCMGYDVPAGTAPPGLPSVAERLPWARAALGVKGLEIGVWVAVESNLGDHRRGLIHSIEEVTANTETTESSPYAATEPNRLANLPARFHVDLTVQGDGNGVPTVELRIADFNVIWKQPAGKPIDVDLVVDFGNTRTVAFAIEHAPIAAQSGLSSVCRFIRFLDRGLEYSPPVTGADANESAIVDSWFVLREPWFSQYDPHESDFAPLVEMVSETKTTNVSPPPIPVPAPQAPPAESGGGVFQSLFGGGKSAPPPPTPSTPAPPITEKKTIRRKVQRIPQTFVEVSPAVMGDHASRILGKINLDQGGLYSLSSPKRYIWDSQPVGRQGQTYWTMDCNAWRPVTNHKLPTLQGMICGYSYDDGRHWDRDTPPLANPALEERPNFDPPEPSYPKRDAVVWSALHILELAFRQITSEGYRACHLPFIPRRLRSVTVTHPSGWIEEEKESYRLLWQRALDIFTLSRFPAGEQGNMELHMDLDEAVASQLPFVYAEIKRLGSIGENWIGLYGRPSESNPSVPAVRILTVDIGGGTTDICVVEYSDQLQNVGISMKYKVLFKDSNTCAGDRVVKRLIEGMLLPALLATKGIGPEHPVCAALEDVFSAPHTNNSSCEKWARITKLVFVPLVRQWLSDLASERWGNPDTGRAWCLGELMGPQGPLVDMQALQDLNAFLEPASGVAQFIDTDTPIEFTPETAKILIKDEMHRGLRPIAKYVAAFQTDVVVLSGKLSELPLVKEMLDELLPISPSRIVAMKDYLVGDWYPLAKSHRVGDAKSVTAVGAALYRGIQNTLVPLWNMNGINNLERVRNAWGAMQADFNMPGFGATYLTPEQDESGEIGILPGTFIGRQRFLSSLAAPEQQYKLVSKAGDNRPVRIKFRRTQTGADGLEIAEVKSFENGETLPVDSVELQLCTLEPSGFWLDQGRFHLRWN